VIRVQDYDELLEVAHLLAHTSKPQVPGIAVVSHSGGISSLTADMCGQAGLDLPTLGEAARDGINGILKGFGWAANPADVTGFANSESFPQIMQHMIADPRMGTLVVASAGADSQAQQVILQRDRTDKGVVFLWTGSRDTKAGLPQLKNARIPIFYTPDKLARGLQSRLAYHTWRERRLTDGFAATPPRTAAQDAAIAQALGLGRPTLSESESKELLAAWGVASAREHRVIPEVLRTAPLAGLDPATHVFAAEREKDGGARLKAGQGESRSDAVGISSAEAAVAAAEQLGFPVALKVDSPDILHKTEAGVVRLNLGDTAQVRTAYAEILANAAAHAPQAQIAGVSVQEMVGDGVEVIVGVSCDPQLGPVLLFGTGGVMVEVYNDVALRRCPITRAEAQAMIAEVKGARLLRGFRGQPAADVEALEDTLVRVSNLAMHMEGHLTELDINPLMVLPAGQGVKAADALIVLRGT
jgi:acetyltransferase